MAIYTDLFALVNNANGSAETLRQKIVVAVVIKANAVSKATPNATQKEWAKQALANPSSYVQVVLNYIVGDYSASTTSAILGATDAQVLTAVGAAVDALLGA